MRTLFACLLSRSISMAGVGILLLILAPLLEKWYQAKTRYYAWLIVLSGFLVLWQPQESGKTLFTLPEERYFSFDNGWRKAEKGTEDRNTKEIKEVIGEKALDIKENNGISEDGQKLQKTTGTVMGNGKINENAVQNGISSDTLLFLIWLSGCLGVLCYQAGKHFRFRKLVKRWSRPYLWVSRDGKYGEINQYSPEWEDDADKKKIPVNICAAITNPMLTGLISPVILLPENTYSKRELAFILGHELVHYRRKDVWWKLFMLIVRAVHWFNPFLHGIFRRIGQECELSCDEEVLKGAGMEERLFYTETLIHMIRLGKGRESRLSALFYRKGYNMKKRIYEIMAMKKKKAGVLVLGLVLLGTAAAGTAGIVSVPKEIQVEAAKNKNKNSKAGTVSIDRAGKNKDKKQKKQAKKQKTVEVSDSEKEPVSLSSAVSCDLACEPYVDMETYWDAADTMSGLTEEEAKWICSYRDQAENISSFNFIREDKNGTSHDIGGELHVKALIWGTASVDETGDVVYEMNDVDFRGELNRILIQKMDILMNTDYDNLEEYLQTWEKLEKEAAEEMEQWANENMAERNCQIINITFDNLWFS